MFELLQVQLSNLIGSSRRMGIQMRKLLIRADKSFKAFDEHIKELDKKVQVGDPQGVLHYFEMQIKDIEKTSGYVLKVEEMDTLYTYQWAQSIRDEVKELKRTGDSLLRLRLDPGLFLAEDTRRILESKGIRSEKDFQKYMENEYGSFVKEITKSYNRIHEALAFLESKTTHQRWGEMISDYMGGIGMASYKALQAGRGLRFTHNTIKVDIKVATKDIAAMQKIARDGVVTLAELKPFFEAEDKLKDALKKEETDLSHIVEYVTNIINFCVYLFFELMKQYKKVQAEEQILEKQRFPEDFLKKMKVMVSELDRHITEETLKARRAASSARGQS